MIAQPEGDGVWIFFGFFIPFLLLSPNKTDMSVKKFDAMRMGEILRRKSDRDAVEQTQEVHSVIVSSRRQVGEGSED